ncbi:MAG: DUF1552 domain-containing protein [Rubripirellula sp.]|nr:DUF1552 domain-containing protein [Rubripirellula sp.]
MSSTRRRFLRTSAIGSSSLLLQPMLQRFRLEAAGLERVKLPQRFVFVVKSSGVISEKMTPAALQDTSQMGSELINESLADHILPAAMKPLEAFKDQLAIVQGLSGKMCRPGHSSWFGAMGVYKTGGEHNSGVIRRATVDAELARLFPSPFNHVGLALRGKVMSKETEGTLYPGITAVGPGRELPFQASPDIAYQQLFGSAIASDDRAQSQYRLKSNLLDFMAGDIRQLNQTLPSAEREKMGHYLNAFEELQVRRERLASMSERIQQAAPEFSDRFTSQKPATRQQAHIDLAAAALISGITNVVTLRLDNISTTYDDLGLSEKSVHGIGHKEVCNGKSPEEARDIIRLHHMKLLADLAGQLKAVPEADGTLLDNTAIIYLSDSGNEHHGNLAEWPYLVIGGAGGRLKIAGRYLRYPKYGDPGHRTIGNWWTTWLNAFGNPIDHYGNLDLELQKNGMPQQGALAELMA